MSATGQSTNSSVNDKKPNIKKSKQTNAKKQNKQSKKSNDHVASKAAGIKKSPLYEDFVIYEFYFPRKYCGKLIGKNGCHVDFVRNATNTQIAVRNYNHDHQQHENKEEKKQKESELQIVAISGRMEDVDQALGMVSKRFPSKFYPNVSFKPITKPIIYRRLINGDDTQSLLKEDKILLSSNMFVDYLSVIPNLEKIQPLMLADVIDSDKKLADLAVNIYVTSIVNATHVFIQLPTNPMFENLQKLDQTMLMEYNSLIDDENNNRINNNTTTPSVPYMSEPIEYGTICVAPTYYGWHRAMVTNYMSREHVLKQISDYNETCGLATIKFLDYGGYLTIPTNQLRQLRFVNFYFHFFVDMFRMFYH